ncbi:MAG: RHS repeat-associated core domain-containing protein, partial [Halanaerobiales bacterium]
VFYFHHDNLGSTRLMTDGAGNVVMEQDYMPFGEDLPVVGQTEVMDKEAEGYKYTGQKEVISIGLYYYGARYYDPSIGRFITEDSYPGEMENPQTQNLYVYVMNNPMKYVDPTGNFSEDEIERINSKLPEGINLEYGDYNESKYFLLTINLRINTNISFEFEWSMRNQELDKFYKENDIFVINAHFFGGNTISGDWITPEGGHQYSYIKEVPRWYVGMFKAEHIKDNIRFEFGRTQYDEFAKAPLIPESRRFEMGIGGIGGLLIDGEYVGQELEDAFGVDMGTKSLGNAPRPAFGVDKNQETAFVFVGVSSWPLQKIADFVKERGVYNMVFFDGGSSTGLIIDNERLVFGRSGDTRKVPSVFKASIK